MPKRSPSRREAGRRGAKSAKGKAQTTTIHKRRRKVLRPLAVSRPTDGIERVLALDVSSKCVGWSVFDDGVLTQHGRYLQQGDTHGEKLSRFRAWLLQMAAEFKPTHLVYEAPYSGRMRNTFGVLSRYAGIVELVHYEHFGVELPHANAVPAHLVKKAIQAKKGKTHEENKKIVTLLVNQEFGLSLKFKANDTSKKVSQDDEADAIALNWAWHLLYRGEMGGE